MDSLQFASGYLEVARDGSAAGDEQGVAAFSEIFRGNVRADFRSEHELDPGFFENPHAPLNDFLVQFEIRNSITEQSAGELVLFVDRDAVSRLIQENGGGESGRPGSRDDDFFAGTFCGNGGFDPAVCESGFDDCLFNLADHDRFQVQSFGAASFAERGADAAGEFRERACGA